MNDNARDFWMTCQKKFFNQTDLCNDFFNDSTFYIELYKRINDGLIIVRLIIVRPTNWFIYYTYGGDFYYLSNNAIMSNGKTCLPHESACVRLRAVINEEKTQNDNKVIIEHCLSIRHATILSSFHSDEICKTSFDLQNFLENTTGSNNHVTFVDILNHLIENKQL